MHDACRFIGTAAGGPDAFFHAVPDSSTWHLIVEVCHWILDAFQQG
jgi:hypothetical protein